MIFETKCAAFPDPSPGSPTWVLGQGAWLGCSSHLVEKEYWGIMRYFTHSKRGAGNLGGCSCCCYFHLTVVESQSPSHLSSEPARQGQSLALKAGLVPNALMTLDRHQILAISKQNLEAPIPGPSGNTPLLPQALLSWSLLIASNPQLRSPLPSSPSLPSQLFPPIPALPYPIPVHFPVPA